MIPRRDFLTLAWKSVVALAATCTGYIGFRFLDSQVEETPFGEVILAGAPQDFEPGTITPFPQGQFYLVRAEDGGFLALHRTCTHLACVVLINNGHFRCPCHGSEFEVSGQVINSPASKPLVRFPVSISDNRVYVDTGKPIERSTTAPEDFVYVQGEPL